MQELHTREQVAAYLREARVYPQDREIGIFQTEFAWVCWMPLTSAEQVVAMRTPGTGGCCIVDARTGVVTSYGAARSWKTWGEMYDESIRTGERLPAQQVFPRQWRVVFQLITETATELDYRVTTESLTQPPQPTAEYRLTITKQPRGYRTNIPGAFPTDCAMAMSKITMLQKNTGSWPEQGFQEY
ncbi:hypothetical protein ACFXHA_06925 [Nocardia sp. NPDC059240]|uniref:hypothetical protein n=1 Tax=Nocardia sp. NPDC059240 TaxID=3346786 RepID=UPI0036BD9D8A